MRGSQLVGFTGALIPALCSASALPFSLLQPRQELKYKSYTAVGDSYASGVGAGVAAPENEKFPECRRNVGSYAVQYALKNPGLKFQFSACSGYQTENTKSTQILWENSAFGNPELVTVQAGGNEGGAFYGIATACAYGFDEGNCTKAIETAEGVFKDKQSLFEGLIDAALTHNMDNQKSGSRTVAVIGYPSLYNHNNIRPDCLNLSPERRERINGISRELNGALAAATKAKDGRGGNKAVFVDIDEKFNGHRLCDNDEQWIIGGPGFAGNHDDNPPWVAYFHPGEHGHQAILQSLLSKI